MNHKINKWEITLQCWVTMCFKTHQLLTQWTTIRTIILIKVTTLSVLSNQASKSHLFNNHITTTIMATITMEIHLIIAPLISSFSIINRMQVALVIVRLIKIIVASIQWCYNR